MAIDASVIDSHQLSRSTTQIDILLGHDNVVAFNAATVFVPPSLKEKLGIVVVEAMNECLPVSFHNNLIFILAFIGLRPV